MPHGQGRTPVPLGCLRSVWTRRAPGSQGQGDPGRTRRGQPLGALPVPAGRRRGRAGGLRSSVSFAVERILQGQRGHPAPLVCQFRGRPSCR